MAPINHVSPPRVCCRNRDQWVLSVQGPGTPGAFLGHQEVFFFFVMSCRTDCLQSEESAFSVDFRDDVEEKSTN